MLTTDSQGPFFYDEAWDKIRVKFTDLPTVFVGLHSVGVTFTPDPLITPIIQRVSSGCCCFGQHAVIRRLLSIPMAADMWIYLQCSLYRYYPG
jgi:hypothetical protein